MATIYSLLIGINGYPQKPLAGCINDVDAVEKFLRDMYGSVDGITLNVKRITDSDAVSPTRENVVAAFDLFESAGDGDSCLVYYSGHGSYSPAPPELWTEADRKSESFVCIDSRIPGGRDLMDKEMGFLIWKAMHGKKNTSFIVITDCCHCGTITRDMENSGIMDRMMPDASLSMGLERYIGYDVKINGESYFQYDSRPGEATRIHFKQGAHIHLSASRDNQTAKELNIDGVKRGAFTYSLLKVLYETQGRISYRALVNRTRTLVRNMVNDQDPDLYIHSGNTNSDNNFLSDDTNPDHSIKLYHDKKHGWCIDAGPIHGVTPGDEVHVEYKGIARVESSPSASFSKVESIAGLDTSLVYRVSVARQPNQQLAVTFEPRFPKELKEQLIEASAKFTRFKIGDEAGKLIIRISKGKAIITRQGSLASMIEPVDILSPESLDFFLGRIAIVAGWMNLLELGHSSFVEKPYKLKLYLGSKAGNYNANNFEESGNLTGLQAMPYRADDAGDWHQPAFRLSIENTGRTPLWVSSAWLGFDYGVSTDYFDEVQLLAPGNIAWLTFVHDSQQEDTILLNLDEKYYSRGYASIIEHLKLFISTQQIDTDGLRQDGIELPFLITRSIDSKSPGSISARKHPGYFDWSAETISFTISRPPESIPIIPGEITQIHNITLLPHPSLRANASLSSSASAERSVEGTTAPYLAKQNSYLSPFDFNEGSRSVAPMDTLELHNVENLNAVSPDNPLRLRIENTDLQDVVAIGFDQKEAVYYRVGYAIAENEIIIEDLPVAPPSPLLIDQRSLGGSIRIYFQKVIGKKLGRKYEYPRLAIPSYAEDEITYDADVQKIAGLVSQAGDIRIIIHGIIGDTESILRSAKTNIELAVKNKVLVLSFDYENLNTSIEENAALLQERLVAVGLKPGHNKQVIIVAHSMGGLVSRWFIEKLQGNKMITKLVMLGTPNNGTPWADVRDMAETLFTYALNGAAFLKPWMFLINIVSKLTAGTQITLKQMDKDSGIYSVLNDGTDPMLEYTIIAGDTRGIIPDYASTANVISRLLCRIRKRGVYDALDATLFREANDIAVACKSIGGINNAADWETPPIIIGANSDHLNYFNDPEILKKII